MCAIEAQVAEQVQVQAAGFVHGLFAEGVGVEGGFGFVFDFAFEAQVDVVCCEGFNGESEVGFLDVFVAPSRGLAAYSVNEVVGGEAGGEDGWDGVRLADGEVRWDQRAYFFFGEPGEVQVVLGIGFAGFAREVADGNFEYEAVFGVGPGEPGVGGVGFGDVQGGVRRWLFVPFVQGAFEHGVYFVCITGVDGGKQGAVCRAGVEALAGGSGLGAAAVMALFGYEAEEFSFGVLLGLGIAAVVRNGEEGGVQNLDDVWVGEYGRTARNAVVSDTAKRVAVHGPDEHGEVGCLGFAPGLPEVCFPGDCGPFLFFWCGSDGGQKGGEDVLRECGHVGSPV